MTVRPGVAAQPAASNAANESTTARRAFAPCVVNGMQRNPSMNPRGRRAARIVSISGFPLDASLQRQLLAAAVGFHLSLTRDALWQRLLYFVEASFEA